MKISGFETKPNRVSEYIHISETAGLPLLEIWNACLQHSCPLYIIYYSMPETPNRKSAFYSWVRIFCQENCLLMLGSSADKARNWYLWASKMYWKQIDKYTWYISINIDNNTWYKCIHSIDKAVYMIHVFSFPVMNE